jgi:NitT/TauT family transport system substrate-binding protein
MKAVAIAGFALLLAACGGSPAGTGAKEVRIPRGAGGLGFLPLLVMEKYQLIEKHAREAGIGDVSVRWLDLGGPSVVNDALLSGSADFVAAGPPAFLTLWDRTRDAAKVTGLAALSSMPMYLNTREARLQRLEDVTPQDKIAVTAIKVSIPAIIMQMYARDHYGASEVTRFDKYTVSMTHPDGVIAMLAGAGGIQAHFTSPPFHQRERKDPKVRTILTSDQVMGGSTTFTMVSTTARFCEQNRAICAAVLKAIDEANAMIVADRKMAAALLLTDAGGAGFTEDELMAILQEPDIHFTSTPQNTLKYAEFMHSIGSLTNRPASWKDLFFADIHGAPGS